MSDDELIARAKEKIATGAYRAGFAAGFAQAKEMAARVARDRAFTDNEKYRDETDWRWPYAFNRVIRASMDIAADIDALTPPAPEPRNEKAG